MGSNGLHHKVRELKCSTPEKRKYNDFDSAWDAARGASLRAQTEIVAYLCADCGKYHLTKKVNGSDVAVRTENGISTGALRKNSPGYEFVPPERVPLPPLMRGLAEQGRVKRELLMEYLKDRDTVTSTEVGEVIDVKASSTIGKYMKNAGWVSSGKGRTAYWLKPGGDVNPIVPIKPEPVREHPAVESKRVWRSVDVTSLPLNATIEDLFGIYKAAGLSLRLQVTDHTDGSGGA